MKNKFKILLIDDTLEVLQNLKAYIHKKNPLVIESISGASLVVDLVIDTLHVRMEEETVGSGQYKVTDTTISDLIAMCDYEFDFIFSDFGFIPPEAKDKNEQLRSELEADKTGTRKVAKQDFQGWLLQLADIKKAIKKLETADPPKFSKLNSKFLNTKSVIQLYTNSPEPFSSYFMDIEFTKREDEVKEVFENKKSKIQVILMHDEFSITPNIFNLFTVEADRKKYYAKLLGHKLTSSIETVILRYMVIEQRKFKLNDAVKAYKTITLIGLTLGAVSALGGEALFHFFHGFLTDVWKLSDWHFPETTIGKLTTFIVLLLIAIAGLTWLAVVSEKIVKKFAKLHTGEDTQE